MLVLRIHVMKVMNFERYRLSHILNTMDRCANNITRNVLHLQNGFRSFSLFWRTKTFTILLIYTINSTVHSHLTSNALHIFSPFIYSLVDFVNCSPQTLTIATGFIVTIAVKCTFKCCVGHILLHHWLRCFNYTAAYFI